MNAGRGNSRLMGCGNGIHWPARDEDVSVESLSWAQTQRDAGVPEARESR
jgi:hypothetical protein